jgi:hypothetical protein
MRCLRAILRKRYLQRQIGDTLSLIRDDQPDAAPFANTVLWNTLTNRGVSL